MEFIFFHAEKQKFLQVGIKWLHFFVEGAGHVQSTQNRKFVIFLQDVKKKVLQVLLCSVVMQNIQIFYKGSFMFIVTGSSFENMSKARPQVFCLWLQ